ncbi:MAG TPA: DUF2834 domain-containing protein [Chthoniobacterales bacterium]|jgi:hypothetical protein|nr:DUF2834 domain-containing protein [Chthoniobacterales bacterium]
MRLRHAYLGLALLGTIIPYWQAGPWLLEHGLDLPLFCRELFASRIGAFFALDVIVSAVVLFVFILSEGRRAAVPRLWLPVAATIAVGVSLGFPLFLYLRQREFEKSGAQRPR